MDQKLQFRINKAFNLDYEKEDSIWLQKSQTLRKLIGILGMGLPIILLIITIADFGINRPLESISHYYYTRAGTVLSVVLSLIAIFLLVYSGKQPLDFLLSSLAGICALLVVFLPTDALGSTCCDVTREYAVTFFEGNRTREILHLVAAAIFLLALATMSLFIFTKSNKTKKTRGKPKRRRNRIYRTCGVLIVLSLLMMLAGFLEIIPPEIYHGNQLTFWLETLAVESFGFAWLIKGETFIKD